MENYGIRLPSQVKSGRIVFLIVRGKKMTRNDILEMVDEMIDAEGDVIIGNLTFSRSDIVRKCDPIAYRMMVNDIIDSYIEDLEYDLQRMDPEFDMEDMEFISEQIAELEDFTF
jgi:hypothetical protein